jgi:hypothetical protein
VIGWASSEVPRCCELVEVCRGAQLISMSAYRRRKSPSELVNVFKGLWEDPAITYPQTRHAISVFIVEFFLSRLWLERTPMGNCCYQRIELIDRRSPRVDAGQQDENQCLLRGHMVVTLVT